ncbi:MAG: recombinase A [Deltaproteobacteria bacterium]|nr:recombinase A [Deltaproteobacteria bacterium]
MADDADDDHPASAVAIDDRHREREFLARAGGRDRTQAARVLSLDELCARRGEATVAVERWGLAALRGRLVELSARGAAATLTCAMELVIEAQTASEPVCWVTLAGATFYPPDAAESGVDLSALVVVHTPTVVIAARAAERVLRSGAFGLVILDLCAPHTQGAANDLSMAHQGRLVTLAQSHDAAVVCLTDKTEEATSLGSLVSLRVEALRARGVIGEDGTRVLLRALKDKRRGPGWTRTLKVRGPAGF